MKYIQRNVRKENREKKYVYQEALDINSVVHSFNSMCNIHLGTITFDFVLCALFKIVT